jgi:NAD-dependent DNA ligase
MTVIPKLKLILYLRTHVNDKMLSLTKLNDYTETKYHKYINSLLTRELLELRNQANIVYYNTGENGLSDDRYDMLVEKLSEYETIGTNVPENGDRVTLPYFMGSLNKIKTGQVNELERWIGKNKCDTYVVENKIDGISCLFMVNEIGTFLYTRGNGVIGSNISHLHGRITNIPKKLGKIVVRGELVMKKNVFREKFSDDFANPRNMVSGILGTKGVHGHVGEVRFVAYEIIDEKIHPEEQLLKLKELGFEVVKYDTLTNLSDFELNKLLKERRELSPYEMDGLVIQPNKLYERNVSGNPSYAFAFKGLSEKAITTVLDVEWNVSKRGLIKPRVSIEPVSLGGVVISYATGFNAKYITDNKIGNGAVIEITRSGDVIPHIVRVVKNAHAAKMPEFSYKWNDSCVDIVSVGESVEEKVKLLASFFSAMEIKHVGEKTVEKLVEGGIDTLEKITKATVDDLLKIKGFQVKTAERIFNNVEEGMRCASIAKILSASGVFGFGFAEKKIVSLMTTIPNLLELKNDEHLFGEIMSVEGFSDISAQKIVDNLDNARELMMKLFVGREIVCEKGEKKNVERKNDLEKMRVVFTGFRDKEMENAIIERGGKVMSSVSSKTTYLVVKERDSRSDKVTIAEKNGVVIYDIAEFREKFSL